MITTLLLLLLVAFQLWNLSSEKKGTPVQYPFLVPVLREKRIARSISGGLLLLAFILFVIRFGIMTGVAAGMVGLMAVGCLVVLLRPYRYLKPLTVVLLYALFLTLEFTI